MHGVRIIEVEQARCVPVSLKNRLIGARKFAFTVWFVAAALGLESVLRNANGLAIPGMLAGSASERLISLSPKVATRILLIVPVPLRCTPLIAPRAARSTVPRAEGKSVRFPTRIRSPENEVASKVGALIADGFGVHVPKGYIYAAMAFSAAVESLNLVRRRRAKH